MRYKDVSLRKERDKDLFEKYSRALAQNRFESQDEIIDFVRQGGAKKFYISGDYCAIVLGRMLKGEAPGVYGKERLRKFADLLELYHEVRRRPGYESKSMLDVCHVIVEMPAPSFYLTHKTTNMFLMRIKKEKRKELCEKWVR